jgi:peptidoglycan/xylan/chitin deacetylase (PgdA/CDA1 family)
MRVAADAPLFAMRFDVDTHRCLTHGSPSLLRLGLELDARFTFFVSMGRLADRAHALRRMLSTGGGGNGGDAVAKLPLRRKLGAVEIARVALWNPRAGAAHPREVRALHDAGHEVGLHGGRGHRRWQARAPGWDERRVAAEVRWGSARLLETGVPPPAGFSSPGWSGSPVVNRALARLGFTYVADRHGDGLAAVAAAAGAPGLLDVRTSVLGEPGGVGYIEWHRAQGHGDEDVVRDFRRRLAGTAEPVVAYDHPYWAGVHDIGLLRRLLVAARQEGRTVVTVEELVRRATAPV